MEQSNNFFDAYLTEIINDLDSYTRLTLLGMMFMNNKLAEGESEPYFRQLKPFLQKEKNNNYSYIYNLATIRLWGILEALVDDFIIHLLENEERVKSEEQIKKINGPLIEFYNMDKNEQSIYLLDCLKQNQKAGMKTGVGRFESILSCVGHGGFIDDHVKNAIFEHSQIRNVLVHKNGKADSRILSNCPWLNLNLGQEVNVTEEQFNKYRLSISWYILEIMNRANKYQGSTIDNTLQELQEKALTSFRTLN
ncbi:hypothetical protein [Paenibacillus rigui]|uniref:Uncharacterized protein n=1 Tax=Paenibacillus rigui TaxID=554312 RepID=A0A229USB0_9BACL|nr:hypothetical protein [Paenibacillus rigui]OXM85799.1 hypothetical protein CF651_11210 [Paenibacillus rigui]